MQPYYTVMRLPGADKTEFIQMLPFTPRLKDNLSAWMVARSDGEHYGRMLVFQFPKQKIVFGPKQIVGKINQDEMISPQITLWNQQGSRVIWGTLLVIPVNESLLYVRPLYLQSPEGTHPRAEAGHRRLSEPHRDGGDADAGARQDLRVVGDRRAGAGSAVEQRDVRRHDRAGRRGGRRRPRLPATPRSQPDATVVVAHRRDATALRRRGQGLKSGDLVLWAEENKKVREIFERLEKIKK